MTAASSTTNPNRRFTNEAPFMRKQIASVPIVRIFDLRTHSKRRRITRPIVRKLLGEKSLGSFLAAPIVSCVYSTSSSHRWRQLQHQRIIQLLYTAPRAHLHGIRLIVKYSTRQRITLRHSVQARAVDRSLDESQAPNQIYPPYLLIYRYRHPCG